MKRFIELRPFLSGQIFFFFFWSLFCSFFPPSYETDFLQQCFTGKPGQFHVLFIIVGITSNGKIAIGRSWRLRSLETSVATVHSLDWPCL